MAFAPSDDDWKFIADIDARFPQRKIMENFIDFLDREPRFRPGIAAFRMNFVDREGWHEIGVKPRVQSLQNHVRTNLEMVRHLTPAGMDKNQLALMNEDHDTSEVITSDFTWDDPITKEEKLRLERLAIKVIFENEPERIKRWEEYVAKETAVAMMLNDFDKLENIYEAEVIEPANPHLQSILHTWKENVWDTLKTDRGRKIFNYLMSTPEIGGTINKFERIAQTARHLNGPQ